MIGEMFEVGIIRPRKTSHCAPMVMVQNKEGSRCMCLDYRDINKITIIDRFPFMSLMGF